MSALAALSLIAYAGSGSGRITDPSVFQRADPWVLAHTDGKYYFTATVPEYDSIEIRRSDTVTALSDAEVATVWTRHKTAEMGPNVERVPL